MECSATNVCVLVTVGIRSIPYGSKCSVIINEVFTGQYSELKAVFTGQYSELKAVFTGQYSELKAVP